MLRRIGEADSLGSRNEVTGAYIDYPPSWGSLMRSLRDETARPCAHPGAWDQRPFPGPAIRQASAVEARDMALNNGIPARIIGRKDGGNAVQSLAYILGLKLEDKQTGIVYDFAHKNERVEFAGVFVPKGGPEWMKDPAILGNTIERMANASTRPHDAQLFREFTPTFPHEISAEQRRFYLTDFARELSRQGYLVIVAAHQPDAHSDERNFHPHMFIGLNEVTPEGFGKKFSSLTKSRKEWQEKEAAFLEHCKERWSELGAKQLERIGLHAEAEQFRHGHKSRDEKITLAEERGDKEYAAQLRDTQPNIHLGTKAAALERKGTPTDRGDIHRAIAEANADRRQLRALKRDLARLDRQDAFEKLKHELTESRKVLAETRRADHEYAQRDPAREQIAWEDKVAKAAIEKEKKDRQFAEPGTQPAPQQDRQQEPARPRFGDQLITRAAETAMRDTQHGETLSSPAAFRDALETNRLALACVTPEEAYKSHRESKFAKAVERTASVYRAGEIVIMREPRNDGNGNTGGRVHKLDQTKAEDYLRCLALDKDQLQGIEATKATLDDRAQTRQRAIDAARLQKDRSRGRSPQRGGMAANQMWALQRVRQAEQQRRQQDSREYAEKQKRDGGEIDSERYRTDPEYRRHAQNAQAYKSPQEKKRDRENDVRAIMEQQDRGGR